MISPGANRRRTTAPRFFLRSASEQPLKIGICWSCARSRASPSSRTVTSSATGGFYRGRPPDRRRREENAAMRALALLAFVAACAPAGAQAPHEKDIFFGAGGCAAQACHGGGAADRQEYKVWATRDRHAKAFDSLAGDLGRRI